jgi:hypothetical protein
VTFVDWADVTRWKVINKQLDLPFDDPAETYSTSEHFFHDMGIAPGTKGRIVPEKPAEPRPERSSEKGAVRTPREDRPRRDRSRSRTRGGQAVETSVDSTGPSSAAAQDSGDAGDKPAGSRNRNRRRRRSGSSRPAASSTD